MNLKNVVKVMNIHSLVRVDKARNTAESFFMSEVALTDMINKIIYNKNLILDKKKLIPNPNKEKLNIYIGNDYGFCGNFNSTIREQIRNDKGIKKIIIGEKIATKDDIDCLMSIRLEMLTVVNNLPENYEHSDEVINESRDYFLNGDQMTVLASDGDKVIGCASMSFIRIMPTFAHPTGKRAHLMNVYTRSEYRRQGIARKMVEMLIEKTWEKGATEISLDATAMGRPLYESMGFTDSTECMVLTNL